MVLKRMCRAKTASEICRSASESYGDAAGTESAWKVTSCRALRVGAVPGAFGSVLGAMPLRGALALPAAAKLQRRQRGKPALFQSQVRQRVDAGGGHGGAALAAQQGKVRPGALAQKFL